MSLPKLDPIPIPAPIWLMKFLSYVTLALHFAAVMILVGSLILVIWHNVSGRSKKDADRINAANVLARRLPTIMTWVINLGVPPLLFAQVLYGRAIYSSSVLIGVMWLSVIFQVILCYGMLYKTQGWLEQNKAAWIPASVALLLALGIGQVYAMNMTLMLRPEVWQEMYAKSPMGLQGYKGDPTTTPRWLFVMSGGLVFGGIWALTHSNMAHLTDAVKKILAKSGGMMAGLGVVLQLVCAFLVYSAQPEVVKSGMAGNLFYTIGGGLTVVGILGGGLLALMQGLKGKASFWGSVLAALLVFLGNAGAVIYRDGIRDVTLAPKGLNVWERTEASNWTVIGAFLLLFVIMLFVIFWLLKVMKSADAPQEQVAL